MADAVAGNIKADRQNLRMGELEKLFAAPDFSAGFAPPWQPYEDRDLAGGGGGGGEDAAGGGRGASVLNGRRRRRACAAQASRWVYPNCI